MDLLQWFHEQTSEDGDCIVWTRSKTGHGYGHFRLNYRTVLTHRWIYERLVGPIPAGLVVMHACDNPPCVNVAHLSVGTYSDNTRDAITKGRCIVPESNPPVLQGETNGRAKLTEVQFIEIRHRSRIGESAAALSREFSVSLATIYRVRNGSTWTHLAQEAT